MLVKKSRILFSVLLLALLALPFGFASPTASAKSFVGAVYTLSNATAGNAVLIFNRDQNGKLYPGGAVSTGGLGLGRGLGSQGALILSKNNKSLFAVNPASNTIASLKVSGDSLELVDVVPSGGVQPTSVTVNNDTIYVLNTGGTGNISGFKVDEKGKLTALAGSTRPLSGSAVGGAQVSFSPNGKVLVVTERFSNKIDTYTVDNDGIATGPKVFNSSGITPFGFAFDGNSHIIVSEAASGAASSYLVKDNGELEVISATVVNSQRAACWVVVSHNGQYAYTSNAASQSLSGYGVASDGSLSLLNSNGVTGSTGQGNNPLDAGISKEGHFLYVLTANTGRISAFEVQNDGQLTPLDPIGGFAPNAAGIAVS